jgi:hypothetical protein
MEGSGSGQINYGSGTLIATVPYHLVADLEECIRSISILSRSRSETGFAFLSKKKDLFFYNNKFTIKADSMFWLLKLDNGIMHRFKSHAMTNKKL